MWENGVKINVLVMDSTRGNGAKNLVSVSNHHFITLI